MNKIRHVVMWRVRGESVAQRHANAVYLRDAFEAMRGLIPGLLELEIGIDHSGVDYACDVVLISEFDTADSLAAYAQHPAHVRAKQAVADLRIERHQVDFAIA